MDETLRLALVNHAMVAGAGYDVAWDLVDRVAAELGAEDVRALADAVREAATVVAWGTAIPRGR